MTIPTVRSLRLREVNSSSFQRWNQNPTRFSLPQVCDKRFSDRDTPCPIRMIPSTMGRELGRTLLIIPKYIFLSSRRFRRYLSESNRFKTYAAYYMRLAVANEGHMGR